MGDDLAELDATAQAELVRNGDASADRARRRRRSRASRRSTRAQRGHHQPLRAGARKPRSRTRATSLGRDGPFRGVPILVKDLAIPIAGEPAHEGMRA